MTRTPPRPDAGPMNKSSSLWVMAEGYCATLSSVFEPLYSPDGRLVAFEMLARLHRDNNASFPLSAERFFTLATPEEMFRSFVWQLSALTYYMPWFSKHQVPVSLNINRAQALACFGRDGVYNQIAALSPWLRLEIHERFLGAAGDALDDPLLVALADVCPLWLDDFGTGSANLMALFSGRFEVIKLDRSVVNVLACGEDGLQLLEAIRRVAQARGVRLVLEGVETPAEFARFRHTGMWALQGWLWPAVSAQDLEVTARDAQRAPFAAQEADNDE